VRRHDIPHALVSRLRFCAFPIVVVLVSWGHPAPCRAIDFPLFHHQGADPRQAETPDARHWAIDGEGTVHFDHTDPEFPERKVTYFPAVKKMVLLTYGAPGIDHTFGTSDAIALRCTARFQGQPRDHYLFLAWGTGYEYFQVVPNYEDYKNSSTRRGFWFGFTPAHQGSWVFVPYDWSTGYHTYEIIIPDRRRPGRIHFRADGAGGQLDRVVEWLPINDEKYAKVLFGSEQNRGLELFLDSYELYVPDVEPPPVPEPIAEWAVPRPYRIRVDVPDDQAEREPFQPFTARLDFQRLLADSGVEHQLSPQSVVVARYDPDSGNQTMIPHLLSEDFHYASRGEISWVLSSPEHRRFVIYFDARKPERSNAEPYPPQDYIALVGAGDNFRYNRPDGLDPIHSHAIMPISADFDGDGRVDLLARMSYGSTWRQPWFTVWFWRNVGTNEEPEYADFVYLRDSDGAPIDNGYNGIALYDWDSDGRPDLVTESAVYRNTGRLTAGGGPVLDRLADLPKLPRTLLGIWDHDGDGIHDAFCLNYTCHYVYEGPPRRNYEEFTLVRVINRAPAGQPPEFGDTEPVLRDGQAVTEALLPSGFYDVDGDGAVDIVGVERPTTRNPDEAQYCYWPAETGPGGSPVYGPRRYLPNSSINFGCDYIFGVQNDAYDGVLTSNMHRLFYCERVDYRDAARTVYRTPPPQPKLDQAYLDNAFIMVDRGPLMQRHARCGVDGYTGVDVKDWEGDGDWDLLGGDELGSIWLIRNIGDNARPVFAPATRIQANGRPIRITRWEYLPDGNPEFNLGQIKVRYVDWDADGDRDLITANNAHRVLFHQNVGSREQPMFTAAEIVTVEGEPAPFAMRSSVVTVDWNGDGLMDLVKTEAANQPSPAAGLMGSGTAVLFLRYRDGGQLRLRAGRPLFGEQDGYQLAAEEICDWDGDGDWDLLGNQGGWRSAGPVWCENVGGNDDPRWARPVALRCFGKQIVLSSHEKTMAAVDWHGNGRLDLVCGGEIGWFYFFRRPALDQPHPPLFTMSKVEIRGGVNDETPFNDETPNDE